MQTNALSAAPLPTTAPDEYEYVWSVGGIDRAVPDWLVELLEHPSARQLEMFLFGAMTGLILSALAVLIGFYVAMH